MHNGGIGRWLISDPAGQYSSPYVGMGNDSVNRVDPTGGVDGKGLKAHNGTPSNLKMGRYINKAIGLIYLLPKWMVNIASADVVVREVSGLPEASPWIRGGMDFMTQIAKLDKTAL
ncbi:hypothetical protein LLH06_10125 [Mucilaginibacter daejeonensis]|uniref:hypothetical protein n=1 Tax=Mucilaginibacter daejeonensis TaxID=398049 RepID=UPI001D1753AF|nr:hypothetical protein [Mucilaginibacter daejeonensis]UEG55316.1 hypothetical protein LLH06_10125 [Mucilaginibacter daejeonensis]